MTVNSKIGSKNQTTKLVFVSVRSRIDRMNRIDRIDGETEA